MFQIIEPFHFFALSSLFIPVFIHLWNKKQTKTLAFGSIQYLPKQKITYLYQLFFADILLLFLRLLLLSLFVLLLTQLFYKHTKTQDVRSKAVFLAPELLPISDYPIIKQKIDSLNKDISSFYYLDKQLTKINHIDSFQHLKPSKITRNSFELMQHIEQDFAAQNDVFIFTSNQLNTYAGKPDILDKSLNINVLPSKTTSQYIAKIERKTEKDLTIFFGTSDAEKTSIVKHQLRLSETKQTKEINNIGTLSFLWEKEKDILTITSKNATIDTLISLQQFKFSQKKRQISLIYDKKRQADVRYLEAALKTITNIYDFEISLKKEKVTNFEERNLSDIKKTKGNKNDIFADVYIWLSQKPISETLKNALQVGKIVLTDAETNDFKRINSLLFREQENGFQTFDIPYLYQISAQSKQEKKAKKHLWTDSFQNEVLVYELFGEKKGIFYQFNSRFHENYTNLVLQVWFPIWLNDLLEKKHLQKTYQLSEHDATTISTNLLPITQSEKSIFRKEEKAKKVVSTSLHFPLWLLIVLLFAIERFWAEGKYRKKSKK